MTKVAKSKRFDQFSKIRQNLPKTGFVKPAYHNVPSNVTICIDETNLCDQSGSKKSNKLQFVAPSPDESDPPLYVGTIRDYLNFSLLFAIHRHFRLDQHRQQS